MYRQPSGVTCSSCGTNLEVADADFSEGGYVCFICFERLKDEARRDRNEEEENWEMLWRGGEAALFLLPFRLVRYFVRERRRKQNRAESRR